MKNTLPLLKRLIPTLALAVMMMSPMWGWGQTPVSYDFAAVGAVDGLNEVSPGIPLDANIGFGSFKNSGTSNPVINSGQLRLYQNETKGGSIKVYASNGVTITQVIVHASGTTGNAAYTVDGGAATDLGGGTTYTMSGLTATSEVEFYVKGTVRVYVDDFEVTYTTGSSGPSITVSSSTLTGFTYVEGNGPSSEQSFTVSGSDLTADISIAATTNYEISTGTGGSFSPTNPITLAQTSGTVAETTIYVRLKAGLSVGDYNSETITATSTGATNKTVTCSGSVTAPPPPDAPVATAATAVGATGFTANWGAVDGATGYFLDVYHGGGSTASDLIISEYIEGSSNNKAIEIYNGTGASIDLSGWNLKIYANGSTTPGSAINLAGTLADGLTYVVANTSANATILALSNMTSGSLTHNGNDAVGLFSGTTLVDVVGPIGDATDWGKDVTLVRKSTVISPSDTYSSSDWDTYGVDVTTYLGFHTMGAGTTFDLTNQSVGNVTSYNVTGLTSGTTYNYVVRAENTYGTSANSNEIEVTTTGNVAPEITNIVQTPSTGINTSSTVSVSADVTDSDGTVEGVALYWGTTSGSLTNNIDMSLVSGSTYTTDTDIPAQAGGATVYYEVYAIDDELAETTSLEQSYYVNYGEPTNHATAFAAAVATPAYSSIDVTWTDATDGTVPDGYVIKASDVSYAAIAEPVDGTEETAGALVKVVAPGIEVANFTGLNASTPYFFKIWPFTNSDAAIDYKTDGSVPEATATTDEAPVFPSIVINEVDADTDGTDVAEFIELFDGGTGNTSLDGIIVVLFNGSNDLSYLTIDLNGFSTNANGYFVIGSTGMGTPIEIAPESSGWLQNGADAVALYYDVATSFPDETAVTTVNLMDALVYDTNDSDDAGLLVLLNSGQDQVNENEGGNSDIFSNQRIPNGTGGSRNTSTYSQTFPTMNEENIFSVAWTGATDTDWATSTNWVPEVVPQVNIRAFIYDVVNDPIVSTEEVSDMLIVDDAAVLTIAPTGYLTVNGALGTSLGSEVVVQPLGKLTVDGLFINDALENSLLIESNATGTGSVIIGAAIADATVQRYLTGGWDSWDAGWHQISSPVAAQPIADFATGNYDFYGWDETTNMWMNYKDAGFSGWNVGTNFNVGQGYLVSYEAANTTQTFTGLLNTADVLQSNLSTNGGSYDGWHLLGNPFASALIWNETVDNHWALSNVAGTAKIWHEANKSYSDIAANGIIPSAQGFMVQVSDASNGITIPADSRVHDAQPFYKSGNEHLLLVAAETEGGSAQESKIIVNPMATEGFDFDYDSRFLAGYAPAFYSVAGDEMLSTNSFPSIDAGLVIPFGFVKNAASTFSIQLKESMDGQVVYLTDTKTGTVSNLTETPVYSFTSSDGDDANRFLLSFGTLGINNPEATDGVQVYAYGDVLYIATSAKEAALVNVYNLTGQLVMQGRTGGNTLSTFNASALGTGIYVVNVVMSNQVISRKVVIRN